MYRLSFLGTGYVGLCTAVCFAERGYEVSTSTYSRRSLELINSGKPPFYEPHLEEMLKRAVQSGRLTAVYGREKAILGSDISFVTVGTPSREDGSIDLRLIAKCAAEIGDILGEKSSHHLVVTKSTVIPGTTEGLLRPLIEKHSGQQAGVGFSLAMNPEFLRQGSAISDTLNPDRIILGEYDRRAGDMLVELYKGFYGEKTPPILRMNLASAELIKYVNNAFLATKISFINEVANMAERAGKINIDLVAKGIGLDVRIAPRFLEAGPGWGGSCFPKDVKALIAYSRELGYSPRLLKAVIDVNERQAENVVKLAEHEVGNLEGKKIAILGLSFKPDTSDTRESPAFKIIDILLKRRAKIRVHDPRAMENTRRVYQDKIVYAQDPVECILNSECCILVTHWREFLNLTPEILRRKMKNPILIDTRRFYDSAKYSEKVKYRAIGVGEDSIKSL